MGLAKDYYVYRRVNTEWFAYIDYYAGKGPDGKLLALARGVVGDSIQKGAVALHRLDALALVDALNKDVIFPDQRFVYDHRPKTCQ
jgi:hypothetical protein